MRPTKNLTGQRFGRLLVLQCAEGNRYGHSLWVCHCDCGKIHTVRANSLCNEATKSCGCLFKERYLAVNTKHGHAKRGCYSRTYQAWVNAKSHCFNPNSTQFKDYGGRGITMCERWRKSFSSFLHDMGVAPPRLTIDRYPNNNGNYEPSNCRWATMSQQRQNQRRQFSVGGKDAP